jgi:hypothetical protein
MDAGTSDSSLAAGYHEQELCTMKLQASRPTCCWIKRTSQSAEVILFSLIRWDCRDIWTRKVKLIPSFTQLLDRLLDHLQTSHLFTSFAPKTLLLHAQRAQMLGRSSSAEAAYAACRYVCNAGSEMELLSRLNIFCLELARCSAADLPRMRQDAQSLIEEVSSFVLVYFDVAASVLTAVTEERISIAK